MIYPLKKVKGQKASVGHILPSERKLKDVNRRITLTVLSKTVLLKALTPLTALIMTLGAR